MEKMNDVFISYSHKDKNVADAIVNHLENSGFRCWYAPRDIQSGQEWADSIINAIGQTKLMVLIFTDSSNESFQVRREVDNALSRGVTIIPFKLTQKPPKGAMEYYLSTLHWLDALNDPLEKSIEELCQRVSMVLTGNKADTKVPVKINDTLKSEKPKKIIIGVVSVLFVFFAFLFIVDGFSTITENVKDSLFGIFLGLIPGIPSIIAIVSLIKDKKPSRITMIIAGVIVFISIIALFIFA